MLTHARPPFFVISQPLASLTLSTLLIGSELDSMGFKVV